MDRKKVLIVTPVKKIKAVTEGGSMRLQALISHFGNKSTIFSLSLFNQNFPFSRLVSFPFLGFLLLYRLMILQERVVIFNFTNLPLATFSNIEFLNFFTIGYYYLIYKIAQIKKHIVVLDVEDLPKIQSKFYKLNLFISKNQNNYFTKKIFLYSNKLWFSSPGFLKYEEKSLNQILQTKSDIVFNSCKNFKKIKRKQLSSNAFKLVFSGNLGEKLGVSNFIDVFNTFEESNKVELHLCGPNGEWVNKYTTNPHIFYWGKYNENEAAALAMSCDVGLIGSPDDIYFKINLPAKLSFYILCGLPIISKNFTETGALTKKLHVGLTSDYTLSSLKKTITEISKPHIYQILKQSVLKHQYKFETNVVYENAIKNL